MALRYESPTQAFGAPTPSELKAVNERSDEGVLRAQRRRLIAKFGAALTGSLAEKRKRIMEAMTAGLIPPGAVPAKETIRLLAVRWNAGAQSLADYMDRPRSGRPVVKLPSEVETFLREQIAAGTGKSARSLLAEAVTLCESTSEHPVTYYQIHKFIAQMGRLHRAAGRHGSRAAQIDGFPHGTVPAKRTHSVWALDELTMPVWIRQYANGAWRSIRADIVLIVDLRSGAVVGYYIVDPSTRTDDNGEVAHAGFDSQDVLAALLAAACPDLAPDSTRTFASYLPGRLRWDNAKQHKTVAKLLKEAGVEIDTRRIPKRRAISNGAAERRVEIVKAWCAGMIGHVDEYTPTDRVDNDEAAYPKEERTEIAGGTSARLTRRVPILPEQLMDVDQLRAEFDRVVYRYNFVHVSRMWGETHAQRYHRYLPHILPRRGLDLVWALPAATTLVGRDGIAHYAHGREYRFSFIRGDVMLMLDTPVTYRADPACRGIFLQIDNRLYFQPPLAQYCENAGEARLARNIAAGARLASDQAAIARDTALARRFGTLGVAAAQERFDEAVQEHEERKAEQRAQAAAERQRAAETPRGQAPVAGPGTDTLAPFLDDDPAAFAFRKKHDATTPDEDADAEEGE